MNKEFDFSKTAQFLKERITLDELKDVIAADTLRVGQFLDEDNCTVIGQMLTTVGMCYELLCTIEEKTPMLRNG